MVAKKKRIKNSNKVLKLSALAISVVVILAIVLNLEKSGAPHRNNIDKQISLNTHRPLTKNAMSADSQFKNLTFAPLEERSASVLDQIAAAVNAIKNLAGKKASTEPTEYGSWIWTPTMQMSSEYMESVLTDASERGINVMYVSIDSYLDIFALPKGPERERRKAAFDSKLEEFIIRANLKGIAVDAEAGWQNWAEAEHTYKAFAVVNYVKDFNENHQNKFRGFQYDVEPYLLPNFEKEPEPILKNFLNLIAQTNDFLDQSKLKFSVVIPDYYDEKDEVLPKFSYNNQKASVFKHLLDILDQRPGSHIILMSYRSFADGYDGSIEISQNEIKTAEKNGHKTKIIIAQETGDVPPPYITFHRISKKYFDEQVSKIKSTFAASPSFGGIAVHYINSFLAMR